ncbi:MAG: PAS domain-containing protein [Planctomycetota bacterium]
MMFDRSKHKAMFGERKRVEQMLRHLGRISEKTEEGIVVVDLKGTIHFANTAWAKMHGYGTSKQLLGKHIHAFHNMTQMQTSVTPSLEQAQCSGEFTGRIGHVRRDGNVFTTHTRMVVLKDEKDQLAGIMVFARDITDSDQLREKLDQTTDRAEKLKQQIEQLHGQLAEHQQTQEELQKYCDQLEQRIEHLTCEPKVVREDGAPQAATSELEPATEKSAEIAAPKAESAGEIAAQSTEETEEAEEPTDMVVPLNLKKLKDIADLAKRLR